MLPLLLDGVAAQEGVDPAALTLCFLFDRCSDASRTVVEHHRHALPCDIRMAEMAGCPMPNAGSARRAAMAIALGTGESPPDLLLTTDADSVPAPDWVACARKALTRADVACGRIERLDSPHRGQDRIERYYDRLHALRRRLDPVAWEEAPAHHFSGGANLAFRTHVYVALGGFAPVPSGEDARIVDDAARAGFRVRRDATMLVRTSARRVGRASAGLAATLRQLDSGSLPDDLCHPADAAWQYRLHARARAAFSRAAWGEVAGALALSPDHVLGVARDCPNAEAFAMRIVPTAPGGMRRVGLADAERALAALEDELTLVAA